MKNVLCLTGDHIAHGDHKESKQVFDLDSVSLLSAVKKLNDGYDLKDNPLSGATDLCSGAVVNPNAVPIEPQILKMKRKIASNAHFFQTQAVFETSKLEPCMKIAEDTGIPVLMGVLLLKSSSMARYVNEKVSGITIPENIIDEIDGSANPLQTGIKIAARLTSEAKNICQGAHIMTVGTENAVPKILKEAGIRVV